MDHIIIKLKKNIDDSYGVFIKRGLFKQATDLILSVGKFANYIIITDSTVKKLYGNELAKRLEKSGAEVLLLSFPAGEKSKNQTIKTRLEEQMIQAGIGRKSLIIALGGGVVGDMAGFVAATYMRGIPYIQIPTTILAMVDSSIGGKTGINSKLGKNLIGAFWQPKQVIVDLDLAGSLPLLQRFNGYFEIIKMALTSDQKLFNFAEKAVDNIHQGSLEDLEYLVKQAVKIKARLVETDEKEKGDRAILNFGHTIGHALEFLSGFKLLHGNAVALGMIVEAKISVLLGLLPESNYLQIVELLEKSGIKKSDLGHWKTQQIIQAARRDKKSQNGNLKIVLLKDVGKINRQNGQAVSIIDDNIVVQALKSIVSKELKN